MTKKVYTIANVAGGDLRAHRLDQDGRPSDAALRHARAIGFGGPVFGGPAAEAAEAAHEREYQDSLDLEAVAADTGTAIALFNLRFDRERFLKAARL